MNTAQQTTEKQTRRARRAADPSQRFATALAKIGRDAEKLETTAGQLLATIRDAKVSTLQRFDELAAAAYRANGWQHGRGRPRKDAETAPVPNMVQVYVAELRAAFSLDLPVGRFDSMYSLRKAIREARRGTSRTRGGGSGALTGVAVSSPDRRNGALFHDLVVVYRALDEEGREAMERALERALRRFVKPVADRLPLAETQEARVLH